jgi:hypothetical protein
MRRRAADFDYRCEANHLTSIASRPSITVNLGKTRPIDRVTSQLCHGPRGPEGARLQACRRDEEVASASLRSRACDEPMREVRVDGEGLTDAQLLHDDEAQTVHGAVRLILVSLEVVEGRSLLVGAGRASFSP